MCGMLCHEDAEKQPEAAPDKKLLERSGGIGVDEIDGALSFGNNDCMKAADGVVFACVG
jgi:hypothetical protein